MRQAECRAHALPLDDRLFLEPFYVTHAGWETAHPHQAYPLAGHPAYYGFTWQEGRVLGEFCLVLVTRGEGELQTRKGRQRVRAGEGFLFQPGEWHRHRPVPALGWTNVWINFNGSLPHRWLREGAFHLDKNVIQVANRRLFETQFRHLVETIDAAANRNTLQFSWQAIGLLSHFLVDAPSLHQPATIGSGDALVDVAINFIWSQSHNQIGVPDVVRHGGMNRRTLERRFHAVTGVTLLQQIQRCRVYRAALLLKETNVPVKYVVGRAGFTSYQRLRLAFQKLFSLSPEAYRLHHAPRSRTLGRGECRNEVPVER